MQGGLNLAALFLFLASFSRVIKNGALAASWLPGHRFLRG
jgi:hypothetical protein